MMNGYLALILTGHVPYLRAAGREPEGEDSLHELGPGHPVPRTVSAGHPIVSGSLALGASPGSTSCPYDLRPRRSPRAQDSMVTNEVDPRRGDDRNELFYELEPVKDDVSGSVTPFPL